MLKLPYENSKSWLTKRMAALQEARANDEGYVEHDEIHYSRLGWIILIVGLAALCSGRCLPHWIRAYQQPAR